MKPPAPWKSWLRYVLSACTLNGAATRAACEQELYLAQDLFRALAAAGERYEKATARQIERGAERVVAAELAESRANLLALCRQAGLAAEQLAAQPEPQTNERR